MTLQNEKNIADLITRFQQSIFSLVLSLIGGDKNTAYDIAAASFVKTIQATSLFGKENRFFVKLAATAIEQSRNVKAMLAFDESDFPDLPSEKRQSLRLTRAARRYQH